MADRPAPSDERGSPPSGHDPGSRQSHLRSTLKSLYQKIRVDPVVGRVKAIFAPPATTVPIDEPYLPRLQIYDGVVKGPALTREQELALEEHLGVVLEQVQTCVRALHLEPITESNLGKFCKPNGGPSDQKPYVRSVYKSYASPYQWMRSGQGAPVVKSDAEQVNMEDANQKKVKAVDDFSTYMKSFIAARAACSEISAEFAQQVYLRIELINRNVQLAVQSSAQCYSLSGLISKLTIPDLTSSVSDSLKSFGNAFRHVATISDCVLNNIGTSPGYFSWIGREADSILDEDFCFKKLKLNSDPFDRMSFALGAQEDGLGVATQEFLMKIKGGNASLFLSAKSKWAIAAAGVNAVANDGKANPGIAEGVVLANANANPDSAEGVVLANSNPDPTEGVVLANANPAPAEGVVLANAGNVPIEDNDVVSVKLALNKVYGQNLKCIIKCPYPSLHGKIAVKAMHPYYAYAGDFGFLQNSKINMSVVGGVKDAGHGLQYVYDYQRHEGKFGVGYTIRSSLSAYGFTFIEPGTFKASYCQKIVDSTTTVAAVASYSPVAGDEHGLKFSLGVKHSIDPSFYVKVRAGSAGIGVALKKSFCAGKFTVKAASNVDVSDPWRRPKIGVVFSCRS